MKECALVLVFESYLNMEGKVSLPTGIPVLDHKAISNVSLLLTDHDLEQVILAVSSVTGNMVVVPPSVL